MFSLSRTVRAPSRLARPRPILLTLALALALAPPAVASGWTSAANLGPGYWPSAAAAPGGEAVVVYNAVPACWYCVADLEAVVRPVGGGWLGPERVGDTGYRGLHGIKAVMNSSGQAVVIWEPGESSSGGGHLMTAGRSAGGPWTPPLDLSYPDYVDSYDVAIDPAGNAVAIWSPEPFTLDGDRVWVAMRPAGGAWLPAQQLTNPAVTASLGVELDGAGRATAVWQEGGSSDRMHAVWSDRALGGSWSPPEPLTTEPVETPLLGVDAAGNATVAWIREGLVQVVERPVSSGAWEAPRGLSSVAETSSALQLAVGVDGTAVVAWVQNGLPYAAVRSASGTWSGAERLSDDQAHDFALGVTSDGTGAAVWVTADGRVARAVKRPSEPWSAPEDLGAGTRPTIASDGDGNAVVAWQSDAAAIMSATWDATGPILAGVSVPERGTVGQETAVSMSPPTDAWSSVAEVGWDFGDSTQATGASAAHVFSAPGVYTVTARAVDALGNASSATRAITVAAAPVAIRPPSGGTTGAPSSPAKFTLSAKQLLINQRIGQAAIRRLAAVEAKLDGRPAPTFPNSGKAAGKVTLSANQLLINQRIYQAAIRRAAILEARLDNKPAPTFGSGKGGTVTLSLRQLIVNQRIAQAAVRRANALQARVG